MHTLTIAEMPSHNHSYTAGLNPSAFQPRGTNGDGTNANNDAATNATGGGGPHNTMPPTLMTNYIIKQSRLFDCMNPPWMFHDEFMQS